MEPKNHPIGQQNHLPRKLLPRIQTHPLKINGWKITFPFEMVPFLGDMLSFAGVM